MKNIFKISIVLIVLGLSLSSLQAQDKIKIDDAVRLSIENNFSIILVKKSAEITENMVSFGNAGMLPKIDASGAASYSLTDIDMTLATGPNPVDITKSGNVTKNFSAAIDLNWTLFDGFAMFTNYNKYEELRDKSKVEIQVAIEGMIKNLINTYYEGLKLQQRLDIIRESISISKDRLNRTRDKLDYGVALKVEVYKAEVDLNADSSNFLQTQLVLTNLKRNFNYLLGRDVNTEFDFDNNVEIKDIVSLDDLRKLTSERNSSINKQIREKQISEYDYELINSAFYPRVGFKTGYSFAKQENDAGMMLMNQSTGFNVGLNFSYNLFDGNKTSIQSQNAKVNILISDLKIDDIKKQIDLNLVNTHDNFLRRKDILRLEEDNLKTSEANFERSKELLDLGQITAIEFRDSQINLMNAKNRINEARYSAKISETELLILSGTYLK